MPLKEGCCCIGIHFGNMRTAIDLGSDKEKGKARKQEASVSPKVLGLQCSFATQFRLINKGKRRREANW